MFESENVNNHRSTGIVNYGNNNFENIIIEI